MKVESLFGIFVILSAGATLGVIVTSLFAVNSYNRGFRHGRQAAVSEFKRESYKWPV